GEEFYKLMRTFKLHAKTTLLSSVLTVAMLIAALAVTSAAIANIERTDDERLAEIQAHDLAQHISDVRSSDPETLTRAANLINGTSVRIWELSQGDFVEKAVASGSAPATPIPEETKDALRRGLGKIPASSDQSLYRVFANIFENGHPSGAVEIVQRFDSIGTVAFRYLKSVIWMFLVAIALILVGTYFLFRQLQLTTKLETERGILRDRVHEATLELEERNH